MPKSSQKQADPMIGRTLNETYVLEQRIGFGGMGKVYAGQHLRLSRPVAIKILLSKYSSNPDAVERFRHEARAASALGHPNIVEVFDFNKSEDGHWYIVMELLEGEDLRGLLKRERRLSPTACTPILRQTCDALDLAHSKGLVHRDLKPSNIFLRRLAGRREVKLLDFGVAKVLGADLGLTMDGAMLGTPHYMAPEQAAGEGGLTPRVDVYAVGTVLFEMLVGRRPFEGDSPLAVLHLRATREAPPATSIVPTLPAEVDPVLRRALARNPSDRFESTTELVLAFERALAEAGVDVSAPDRDRTLGAVSAAECGEAETMLGTEAADLASVGDGCSSQSIESQAVAATPSHTSTSAVRLQSSDELRMATIVVVACSASDDEEADPDELLEQTEAVLEQLAPEVTTRGGVIEQRLGESLTAVFGVPAATGDDALRAVRAALAARELGRRSASKGIELRIGVHTGRILRKAGRTGVTGDVVKVAARLADECPAGDVLVGHETFLHIRGRFDVSFRDQVHLRGMRKPLRTYRVTGERDHGVALGPRGGAEHEAAMVGREPELAFLQALYRRATRERQAQAVVVVGGPGTGKSRLAHELLSTLEERSERPSIFPARAGEMATPSPYGLLAEVIRVKAGSSRALTPLEAGQKLLELVSWPFGAGTVTATATSRHVDRQSLAPLEIANALGAAIGVQVAPGKGDEAAAGPQLERLTHALGSYLSALADREPVLLVLDDLHRADEESLSLLEHTLLRLEELNSPVMLLALARPELLEARPGFLSGFEHVAQVVLHSLSEVAVTAQIATLLGHAPPPGLGAAVHKRSGGNPHLVEEMVHALRESGALTEDRKSGAWTFIGDLTNLDVPSRAEALLQARLDQLPAEEREVLRCAAVIGAVFWEGALRHLGLEAVGARLDALAQSDHIHLRPTSRFPGTRQWAFKSELMCEVASGNVPARDRRRIHQGMAEWLERQGRRDPESLSMRARHLAASGERAAALDLLSEAAEQAERQQRWQVALACYQQAHDLARAEEDRASQLFFAAFIGRLAVRAHVPSKGIAVLDEAVGLAESSGEEVTRANLLQLLGRNLAIQGEAARAREVTERAREVAERLGDLRLRFETAKAHGFVLYYTDDFAGSSKAFEQCMEMARELGDQEEVIINLYNVADSSLSAGDADRALEFAEKADRAGHGLEGLLFIRQKARGIGAYLRALRTGDPTAIGELQGWIAYADEKSYVDQRVEARYFLAEVLARHDRRDEALAVAHFALDLARSSDDSQSQRRMLELLARLEAGRSDQG
jgi:serine/threonine protein kinase/predicted ATPase